MRKYLSFGKGLSIQMQAIGKYYIVATIVENAHSCLYGNQSQEYFLNILTPDLEDYFHE